MSAGSFAAQKRRQEAAKARLTVLLAGLTRETSDDFADELRTLLPDLDPATKQMLRKKLAKAGIVLPEA